MEDGWRGQPSEEAAEDLRRPPLSAGGGGGQVSASLSSRHLDMPCMDWFGFLRQSFPMEPRVIWNLNAPDSGVTVLSGIMMCSSIMVGSGIMGAFWDCSAFWDHSAFWVHSALNLYVGFLSKAELQVAARNVLLPVGLLRSGSFSGPSHFFM